MADGFAPPAGQAPSAPPSPMAAPGAAPQQRPTTGPSPATMPVANRGLQAEGLAQLATAVQILEEALPNLGMGSEAGMAVHSTLPKLSKHIPPGSVSPGVQMTVLQKIMMKNRQNAMQVAQMRAGGAQPGGAAGAPPPGSAPPPSPAPPPMARAA